MPPSGVLGAVHLDLAVALLHEENVHGAAAQLQSRGLGLVAVLAQPLAVVQASDCGLDVALVVLGHGGV
jgi:hypothetical protein